MRTTMGRAGRVVIPKSLRDEAGLEEGAEVEIVFRDGRNEIEPATAAMCVVKRDPGAAIDAEGEMPLLTSDAVRDVLERTSRSAR
jgi:AbrB family looped-hinge helix DNA binding protein